MFTSEREGGVGDCLSDLVQTDGRWYDSWPSRDDSAYPERASALGVRPVGRIERARPRASSPAPLDEPRGDRSDKCLASSLANARSAEKPRACVARGCANVRLVWGTGAQRGSSAPLTPSPMRDPMVAEGFGLASSSMQEDGRPSYLASYPPPHPSAPLNPPL